MELFEDLKAGPPFKQATWWIDEKGREHLIEPLSPSVEKWFLRHLGQVKIELLPRLMEITWNTGLVRAEALESVKFYLSMLNENVSVRLSFYYHGWIHEVFRDVLTTIERIDEIQDYKSVAILHETWIRNCPISDVFFAGPRIKQGYENWERTAGRFDRIDQSDFSKILSHALMFRPDGKEENILISWVGIKSTSAQVYGAEWVQQSIGKISNHSFGIETQSHADKVSIGIAETLSSGEPRYQHIRALMRIEGEDPFWVPYERLLTPYVLRDGSPMIICDVYPTQYVNISFAGSP